MKISPLYIFKDVKDANQKTHYLYYTLRFIKSGFMKKT